MDGSDDRRPSGEALEEFDVRNKKQKTASEDARQAHAFSGQPNFFAVARLDWFSRTINPQNKLPFGNPVAEQDFEEEVEEAKDDDQIGQEQQSDVEDDVDEMMQITEEKDVPKSPPPPVEYDGFEQIPDRLEITVKGEIKRMPKIKSRGKKKVADAIEVEEEAPPRTLNIIVYKGVVEETKPAVEERHFVMLITGLYILAEVLRARLEGNYAEEYKTDWEQDDKGERPFTLWTARGRYEGIGVPGGTFVRAETKIEKKVVEMTKEQRVSKQYDYWKRVAERAESPPKRANNVVVARYWDLPGKKKVPRKDIMLRIEPCDEIDKVVLKKLLTKALGKCRCQPDCEIVERDKGDIPSPGSKHRWVLIGKHLLNLYKLYASPETIKILHKEGQRKEARPFPTAEQAKKADDELFRKLQPHAQRPRAQSTETSMTQHKVSAVVGEDRGKGQGAVMNNVSATKFAEIFGWPKNDDGTAWENQAEWLHRSAFSFGGMNDTASKLSSQTIRNLIFGTKEANTFMIRPESTIKNITTLEFKRLQALKKSKQPARAARKAKITSTLSTRFDFKHYEEGDEPIRDEPQEEKFKLDKETAARLQNARPDPEPTGMQVDSEMAAGDNGMATESETNGEEEAKHNPKWMKTQKYSWLAPQLEYEFQIELSHLNRSMNAKLIIEPFSRTIPMRLEAQLDKLVEDHVFGVRGKDLQGNPGVKPENRKRARSLTMASVGQYGTGTKAADDPLSKLPFTPAYKEQKPQTKPRKKK